MNLRKSPLPEIYKNPVTRKPAGPRVTAINRVPAGPRKRVGFINDGKPHAVLDTNIIINALEAEYKGGSATPVENECRTIVDAWRNGKFAIGLNTNLYQEYQRVGLRLVQERKISLTTFNNLISRLGTEGYFLRMYVTKQHVARSYADDHLFDGLSAEYLVTEDCHDVREDKVMAKQRYYSKIIGAAEFVSELKKLGLL